MIKWRRQRLAHLAADLGGPGAVGKLIGHATGTQVGHMISGQRVISEKTMDAIHAIPGLAGWFHLEGETAAHELTMLACLRYLREELENLPAAKRQMARIALKHFVDNPDELLEVAQAIQGLRDS